LNIQEVTEYILDEYCSLLYVNGEIIIDYIDLNDLESYTDTIDNLPKVINTITVTQEDVDAFKKILTI
jgi:hypothetical protein